MIKYVRKIAIVACYLFISLVVINAVTVSADLQMETLYINGQVVTHLYTGKSVSVPVTYTEDVAEMRGAWVSTVWNNDVKKQNGTSENAINGFKEQYLGILDQLEKFDMNTIFFQIRPCNDAFYPSDYNDWSKFLVAAGTDPGWDPLAWMIEVTHERGMYFQGWMNAFRVTETQITPNPDVYNASHYTNDELVSYKNAAIASLASKNFAKQHPEYVLLGEQDKKLILNPGEPAVQQHILNTISEIITNYDIDGVHFDDYFYLHASGGSAYQTQNLNFAGGVNYNANYTGSKTLNDLGTYQRYQANPSSFNLPAGLTLGDFRRQSINKMMASIRELVDEHNSVNQKNVEYGSKPAAVWQSNIDNCPDNQRANNGGSNTSCYAYSSNYDLFADSRYWVEQGYVDWVAPQVYFDFLSREVPYADIVDWWADIVTQTNERRSLEGKKPIKMYVAHGIYKLQSSYSNQFIDENEVVYQMKYNQKHDVIKGSAVYAYTDLKVYGNSTHQRAITNFYSLWNSNRVLPLPRGENDGFDQTIGDYQLYQRSDISGYELKFAKNSQVMRYIIYRVNRGETFDQDNTNQRLNIIKSSAVSGEQMLINIALYNDQYDYYIQTVNQNHYRSSQITKLDFTNANVNQPPTLPVVTIDNQDGEVLYKEDIIVNVQKATDPDGDELIYEFDASVLGIDGSYVISLQIVEETPQTFTLKVYASFYSDDFVVRVKVSDPEFTETAYSNSVKIVDEYGKNDTENPPNKTCQTGVVALMIWFSFGGVLLLRRHK